MGPQNLHFTRDEYAECQEKTRTAMLDQGLDGMLLFKIEDMYWLCGLDTDGFSIFHAMFIGTNDELTHVSRGADLANVRYSSVCDDVCIWVDAEGNPKSRAIKDTLVASHGYEHAAGTACDYTMGVTWMEQPQIFANNSVLLEANMTFFTHMILIDHDAGLTMSLGEQAIVTEGQPEIITRVPRTPLIAR